MSGKSPNRIDVHVGSRLRTRRIVVGMSQEKLGDQLGLTFQQVQKYEKGLNRIGASRLYAISRILGTSIQYFFEDMPSDLAEGGDPTSAPVSAEETQMTRFVNSPEGVQLNLAFSRIQDSATRRRLTELVRTLAAEATG